MLQLPNLGDRTFDGLMDDAVKLIRLYDPSWTDHNLYDPGITLAELFCWLIEALEYYLNYIGGNNYLKYLRLLSVEPGGAESAGSRVAIEPGGKKPAGLTKGARLAAGDIPFETAAPLWAHPFRLMRAVTSASGKETDVAAKIDAGGIYPLVYPLVYPLGERPAPGNAFTLMFSAGGVPYQLPGDKPLSLYFGFDNGEREPRACYDAPEAAPFGASTGVSGGVPYQLTGGVPYQLTGGVPYQLTGDKPLSLYFGFDKGESEPGAGAGSVAPGAVPLGASTGVSGGLLWEYFASGTNGWRTLRVVQDETLGLRQSGRVVLQAPFAQEPGAEGAKPGGKGTKPGANGANPGAVGANPGADFAVRARVTRGRPPGRARLREIAVNAVDVTQRRTVSGFQDIWWRGPGEKARVGEYTHCERNKVYFLQYQRPEGFWRDFARTMYRISFKGDNSAAITIRNKTIPPTDGRGVRLRLASFYRKLPVFEGSGFPFQRIDLPFAPVLREGFHVSVRERVVTRGKVTYEWFDWERVNDFDASGPSDRHYALDSAEGRVSFGDGLNGAVPKRLKPFPYNIRILSYAACEGAGGNMAAGKIDRPEEEPPGQSVSVRHFAEASGGRSPESIPAALGRMREELRETSAVTAGDYERLAAGAGAARVKAVPLFVPDADGDVSEEESQTAVCVVAAPFGKGVTEVSDQFLGEIRKRLEPYRLLTTRLYVRGPEYAGISVEASVRFKPGRAPDAKGIADALDAFLSPFGDGKSYEGWPFGRTVYKSEIYRVIKKAEGVDYVEGIALRASGAGFRRYNNGNVELSPICLAYGERHFIEII